jgi:glutamine amidotransferase
MCIAICKPAGKEITDAQLKLSYLNNDDGCGLAYIKDEKIIIYKQMDYIKFVKKLRSVEKEFPESPILIHFRATSVGKTDLNNCHPFRINKNQVFCHNGTIKKVTTDKSGKMSDTAMFNKEIMKELPYGWEKSKGVRRLIEEFICINVIIDGRVCVLNVDGTFTIFNEDKGHWFNGIWWSNDYYKTKRTVKQDWHGVGYSNGYVSGTEYDRKSGTTYTKKELEAFFSRNKKKEEVEEDTKLLPFTAKPKRENFTCEWCTYPTAKGDGMKLDWGTESYNVCKDCHEAMMADGLFPDSAVSIN